MVGLLKVNNLLIVVLAVIFSSCANHKDTNEILLRYQDFGPQVIAYEIIGMQWWQWDEHGDSRPAEYDISVIVYKHADLEEIKRKFPVSENKQQDYRYVTYQDAITFLNSKIEENAEPSVTERLKNTLNLLNIENTTAELMRY